MIRELIAYIGKKIRSGNLETNRIFSYIMKLPLDIMLITYIMKLPLDIMLIAYIMKLPLT